MKKTLLLSLSGILTLGLFACSTTRDTPSREGRAPPTERRGGYYQNDGPGDHPPANLAAIPDAVPRWEPLHRFANRPYTVFGREYVPATALRAYQERGIASWYGKQFHGQKTSTGEIYDMYAMTAAHPTLPVPSYARVTHLANNQTVVVRVNDRGPFHAGRIIDLSYAAAFRLGIVEQGKAEVLVESILPAEVRERTTQTLAPLGNLGSTAQSAALPVQAETGGYFLQLGAFANYANAESFLNHVRRELLWIGEVAAVRQKEGLFRVQLGPYSSLQEAQRIGAEIRERLSIDSTVKHERDRP